MSPSSVSTQVDIDHDRYAGQRHQPNEEKTMTDQSHPGEPEEFDQGWIAALEQTPLVGLLAGLVGLTRLGERPAPLERLAVIVDRSAAETAALVDRKSVV